MDDFLELFNQTYNPIADEVNKYADELISIAQGDYDFAAKWIENEFQRALGTDNTARAGFLKEVANNMESKVGRIAFDYQTGKYRTEQDMQVGTERTQFDATRALERLNEDERIEREKLTRTADDARQTQAEQLNERGIIQGTREDAQGLAGSEVRRLETDINDEFGALERLAGRSRENITLERDRTLEDIDRTGTRSLEDLTTTARRSAEDATDSRGYQLGKADIALSRAKRAAEIERRSGLNQAKSIADYYTRGRVGAF